MKIRCKLILIFALCAMPAMAQDTLRWGDTNYFWNPYRLLDTLDFSLVYHVGVIPGHYTSASLLVHGLAVPATRGLVPRNTVDYWWACVHGPENDFQLVVIQEDSAGNVSLIYSQPVSSQDYINAKKTPKLIYRAYGNPTWEDRCDTVLEFFFPQPVQVQGTFWTAVGDSRGGWFGTYMLDCVSTPALVNTGGNAFCVESIKEGIMTGVIPIVSAPDQGLDSALCPAGPTPQLIDLDTQAGLATIVWLEGVEGLAQQVSLGTCLTDPECNPVYTFHRQMNVFSNLEPGHTYSAWVRNQCRHVIPTSDGEEFWWGDWSEPLVFSIGTPLPDTLWLNDSTYVLGGDTIVVPHEGIWEISDSRNQISIFPNPTTGDVSVECGEWRVERIEVLDPQGRLLMEKEYSLSPKPYTLNLSSLPKGSYLLRIHTGQGAITRKVVRE